MPPRYAYWTIIAGGLPTAFRTSTREELLPTFHRIREKHPDAEMRWFTRGKLWASPEEAQAALDSSRRQREGGRERGRREGEAGAAEAARGRDWRPGGEHRDPRQRFKDARKARNLKQRRERWERKTGAGRPDTGDRKPRGRKGPGERASGAGERRPWAGKAPGERKPGPRPAWKRDTPDGKPEKRSGPGSRPAGSWKGAAGRKPTGGWHGKPGAQRDGRAGNPGGRPGGLGGRRPPRPPRKKD